MELKVFKNIKCFSEIFNNWPNDLLGRNGVKDSLIFLIVAVANITCINTTPVISKWDKYSQFNFWLSYFEYFQIISLFQELKVQDNTLI